MGNININANFIFTDKLFKKFIISLFLIYQSIKELSGGKVAVFKKVVARRW